MFSMKLEHVGAIVCVLVAQSAVVVHSQPTLSANDAYNSTVSHGQPGLNVGLETPLSSVTAERPVYSSCKEILNTGGSAPSGEYTIRTVTGRILNKVYCEMGLNGGGYTFINPTDLPSLTNGELQVMFTDTSSFLMRVQNNGKNQPYAVLKQLHDYQGYPLKLGLNDNSGYSEPANINHRYLNPPYLYFGFIPAARARNRHQQGLMVNGQSVTFRNCDSNPNSYIALFPNFAERSSPRFGLHRYQFCIDLFSATRVNPSRRMMPVEYFMFMETHWGGCGCFAQTDDRVSINGVSAAAIGFR